MDKVELPNDVEQLKQIILRQQSRLVYLEEQFRLAQQKRFGASSEGHPGQGELFNEAEAELEQPEPEKEEPTTSPRKKPNVNRYLKTCPVKLWYMIFLKKIKSVLAATVRCIKLVKTRVRSWNSSLLRLK
jgi:hypothetical protein